MKRSIWLTFAIMSVIFAGCFKDEFKFNYPDFPNTQFSWFSTDLESDTLIFFASDNAKTFRIRTQIEGINVEIDDGFIAKLNNDYSVSDSEGTPYTFTGSYSVTPRKVGKTFLKISAQEHCSYIHIKVLEEYYTFTEPNLDFDDTRDSVTAKILKIFHQIVTISSNTEDPYIQVEDSRCKYNLYVNYSDAGTIDSYIIDLYQGVDSSELIGYVSERYYKTTGVHDGLPVYIKAYNIERPSISDATVIVMPNTSAHKITYQNPMTYSK